MAVSRRSALALLGIAGIELSGLRRRGHRCQRAMAAAGSSGSTGAEQGCRRYGRRAPVPGNLAGSAEEERAELASATGGARRRDEATMGGGSPSALSTNVLVPQVQEVCPS